MFKRDSILKLVAGAVVAASLTGCGGGTPNGVEEEWSDEGGYTDPSGGYGQTGTGGYGQTGTGGYGAGTGTGQYGGTTGGYGGGAAAVGGDLTASIIKKKNGTIFGIGTFKVTVEVSNPSSVQKTGTLTVTFKNGSKTSKTAPVTQSVSLGPNETKTFDFEDKKWSTDSADCEITTDASSAGAAGGYGAPATGGYGAPATGAYGAAPAAGGYGAPATGATY